MALGKLYDGSAEFLDISTYKHLVRWAQTKSRTGKSWAGGDPDLLLIPPRCLEGSALGQTKEF